ncbi:hypothetical protein C7380_1102 [Oceanotoga teriensis]|uniref:Uncharacterized protein n=1 Tax=Oceanotoga teriensis TaxID=515440 RepID=A0AA45C6B2_9BACT|nr:hypothetical protein [Oceanotoga teriensis]PWJ92009.1 hypothetical protein C7380_1102 [Oceanotoga teriensis]
MKNIIFLFSTLLLSINLFPMTFNTNDIPRLKNGKITIRRLPTEIKTIKMDIKVIQINQKPDENGILKIKISDGNTEYTAFINEENKNLLETNKKYQIQGYQTAIGKNIGLKITIINNKNLENNKKEQKNDDEIINYNGKISYISEIPDENNLYEIIIENEYEHKLFYIDENLIKKDKIYEIKANKQWLNDFKINIITEIKIKEEQ